VPGQGAIPAAAAICTGALLGAFGFANQTLPAESNLGWMTLAASNNATSIEIVDRLAHMGGLNATLLTAQGALTLAGLPAARLGDANYSDVQWWLEWYVDTGATASNATVNVTYNDDTTGNLAVIAVGGTVRAGRLLPRRLLATSASRLRAPAPPFPARLPTRSRWPTGRRWVCLPCRTTPAS
jgi:hypothetical protein